MNVKLYYGASPATMGPFTVKPQGIWMEGRSRIIQGESFIEVAVEGSPKMAPVAAEVVKAVSKNSRDFTYNPVAVWGAMPEIDPVLEQKVIASVPVKPKPEPVAPKPATVEQTANPSATGTGDDELESELRSLIAIADDGALTAMHRVVKVGEVLEQLESKFGANAVRSHPRFEFLIPLFDDLVEVGLVFEGFDMRDYNYHSCTYLIGWRIQRASGTADPTELLKSWHRFFMQAYRAMGVPDRMAYYLLYKEFRSTMHGLTLFTSPHSRTDIRAFAPNYLVETFVNSVRADMQAPPLVVMETSARELSNMVSEAMKRSRNVALRFSGNRPPIWHPATAVIQFIENGCPNGIPFSHLVNVPVPELEISALDKFLLEELRIIPVAKRQDYCNAVTGLIEHMAPTSCILNGDLRPYQAAEDRRWPAVASAYRFIVNRVWERMLADAPEPSLGTCADKLEERLATVRPFVAEVATQGFQPIQTNLGVLRRFTETWLAEKGATYAKPATDLFDAYLAGYNPLQPSDFATFESLINVINANCVSFGAEVMRHMNKSPLARSSGGVESYVVNECIKNIMAAQKLVAEWRPIGMGVLQFAQPGVLNTQAAKLHRQMVNWIGEITPSDWVVKHVMAGVKASVNGESEAQVKWRDAVANAKRAVGKRPAYTDLTNALMAKAMGVSEDLRTTSENLNLAAESGFDLKATAADFGSISCIDPYLPHGAYVDALDYIARSYNAVRHEDTRKKNEIADCLFAVRDFKKVLMALRPVNMSLLEYREAAPDNIRRTFIYLESLIENSNRGITEMANRLFSANISTIEQDMQEFLTTLKGVAARPNALTTPLLADVKDFISIIHGARITFKAQGRLANNALENDPLLADSHHERRWDDFMSSTDLLSYLPIYAESDWEDVRSMILYSAKRDGVTNAKFALVLQEYLETVLDLVQGIRPLVCNIARWRNEAPEQLREVMENLLSMVSGKQRGADLSRELIADFMDLVPAVGLDDTLNDEIERMREAFLYKQGTPAARYIEASEQIKAVRDKALANPATYAMWEKAFASTALIRVLDMESNVTADDLEVELIAGVGKALRATTTAKVEVQVALMYTLDMLNALRTALRELRPLNMTVQAWEDEKQAPSLCPSIRRACNGFSQILAEPTAATDFVLEHFANLLTDAGRYGKKIEEKPKGKISYAPLTTGGDGSGNYVSVTPTVPPAGNDVGAIFLGSTSHQASKMLGLIARDGGFGDSYSLPDDILNDLAQHSKCLGITYSIVPANFIVVGTNTGSTGIITLNSGGRMVSIVQINMEQIGKLFGACTTQAILHALTHEFAHYFHRGLKGTAAREWRKATGGRTLHPTQGRGAYAFDTEQFAILAETMVWGDSVRGLYTCNGINVVERFFVNNFITAEDRQKLA